MIDPEIIKQLNKIMSDYNNKKTLSSVVDLDNLILFLSILEEESKKLRSLLETIKQRGKNVQLFPLN